MLPSQSEGLDGFSQRIRRISSECLQLVACVSMTPVALSTDLLHDCNSEYENENGNGKLYKHISGTT